MKTTTVEISRATEIDGKMYWGSDHIVPVEVAKALIECGAAKSLDPEFKRELKAETTTSGTAPPAK